MMVITMAKLRMAHASTHGARKPPGPTNDIFHDCVYPHDEGNKYHNLRIKIKIRLGLTGGNSGGGVLVPCLDFKYEIKERILLIIKLINHL